MLHSFAVEAVANLVEKYLANLPGNQKHGAALPETSYYPALRELLNGVGATLKPKVRCVIHISHGAGFPDGGLFTSDQFQKGVEPLPGTMPSRAPSRPSPPAMTVLSRRRASRSRNIGRSYGQVLVTTIGIFCWSAPTRMASRCRWKVTGLPLTRSHFGRPLPIRSRWRASTATQSSTSSSV